MTRRRTILLVICSFALLATTAASCGSTGNSVQKAEKKYQLQTQQRLSKTIGFPQVKDSLELRNLKRRYELLDDKNRPGYVYLIDHGLVFAEYTVKGKVSSLGSQFTNPEQITDCGTDCAVTTGQAEPDGSYGDNPPGIFFWTSDDVYVEWAGNFLYSEKRLDIQQPSTNIIAKQAK